MPEGRTIVNLLLHVNKTKQVDVNPSQKLIIQLKHEDAPKSKLEAFLWEYWERVAGWPGVVGWPGVAGLLCWVTGIWS